MKAAPLRMLRAGVILFVAGPCAGLFMTVIGMIGAFHSLGETGIADPKGLAGHVSVILLATVLGLVVSGFGLVTMAVAAIAHFVDRKSTPLPTR